VPEQGFQTPSVFRLTLIIAGQKMFFQADGTGFLGQIVILKRKRAFTAYPFSSKTPTDGLIKREG
jgi:hypothetical protein